MVLFQTGFSFGDAIDYLVNIGVYDIFLPFLLIFSIVFAILEKTSILGKDKTNINVIVSVVIGLLLVVQRGIVEIINLFLPRVSLIIVVILVVLLLIAMVVGKEFTGLKGITLGIAVIVILIAVIIALTARPTAGPIWLTSADRDTLLRIGIPVLIFILVISLVTYKPKRPEEKGTLSRALKGLAREVGGEE